MGGRHRSESVAGLRRNQWPAWLGIRNEELGLNWQQVHQVLEALWSTQATQTTRAIDRIRREVYLAAYSVTQSPDCAAYSSEDFGLFAMASVVGFHDAWLEALYQEYERMGFAT